jgi:amino-acid N-acetyltransferase
MVQIINADQVKLKEVESLLNENDLPVSDLGPHVELMLLREEDKIIAMAGAEQYKPHALLRSVAVDKTHQQRGLGKRIVILMLDYLTINGISDIYLLTTTVPGFFAKLGFQEIKRDSVPELISQTKEFADICPDSAVCMHYATM